MTIVVGTRVAFPFLGEIGVPLGLLSHLAGSFDSDTLQRLWTAQTH